MTLGSGATDGTISHDQRILDARMEYEQLLISDRTMHQMWWIAVSAFFAINTLLATALGFSYAKDITFNQTSLTAIHVLIPTTGAFFSYAAIYTANLLTKLIRLTNERGRELEKFLAARMFGKLQPYAEKSPRVTIAASLLFLLLWAAALLGGILH